MPLYPPAGGGSSSVAWGGITGTLSAQTDLQTELNAKATLTHGSGQHDASVASIGAGSHIPTYQLGSGTADATTFLRGDQTYAAPPGGANPFTMRYSTIDTQNNSNANWASVNYVNFALAASSRYIIEGFIRFRTAVTSTGIAFAWNYGSGTQLIGQGIVQNAAATANMMTFMGAPASVSAASTANQNANLAQPAYLWAVASTTGGSSLTPLFRSEVNASFATVQGASLWRMMAIT